MTTDDPQGSGQAPGLQFPLRLPDKSHGDRRRRFHEVVIEIIRRHCDAIQEDSMHTRASSGGKYVSVSIVIEASSRAQLDAIYDDHRARQGTDAPLSPTTPKPLIVRRLGLRDYLPTWEAMRAFTDARTPGHPPSCGSSNTPRYSPRARPARPNICWRRARFPSCRPTAVARSPITAPASW